jgi:hypothetical protein
MMNRVVISVFILFCINLQVSAQNVNSSKSLNSNVKHWIYFTDKNNSRFSTSQPSGYLSPASIERRKKQIIPIREMDLPVNEIYISTIKTIGAEIIVRSRWMNAVSVVATDEQLALISELPFVNKIENVRRWSRIPDDEIQIENQNTFYRNDETESSDYGGSFNQINMIHINDIHDMGFRGEGMIIAVLDAGFSGVDTGVGFQSFWEKGQIIETHNFPDHNDFVFFSSSHGSNVLSIMGADVPGTYIGSAPDAKFYLLRTEIADSESVAEEDYWLQAAEFADSVGADVINSSLGYTTFDNPFDDHTYADMDGNTTIITKAADWAASVGILVCNSAGNSGNDPWKYIGAPADGDSVFTIGAVDGNKLPASFSSIGPTSDGRLKPNVVCQGAGTAVLDKSGFVYTGSGTSYSSPLMAGACASFWQAFPEYTNMQIMDVVQRSADHYFHTDNKIGYGIPDFNIAYRLLKNGSPENEILNIFPNPAADYTIVQINSNEIGPANLDIYDVSGKFLRNYSIIMHENEITSFVMTDISNLASGIYILSLTTPAQTISRQLYIK